MKKLSSAFSNDDTKKKSSALTKENIVKVEETTPRKINESDYEVIRKFAFDNKLSMLEATEYLYKEIDEIYFTQKDKLCNADLEYFKSTNQKSIRISSDFNNYLKEKSNETRIPLKFILSYFINVLRERLV